MNEVQNKLGGGLNKIQDSLQQGKQKLQHAQEMNQLLSSQNVLREKRFEQVVKIGELTLQELHTGHSSKEKIYELKNSIQDLDQQIYSYGQKLEEFRKQQDNGHSCPKCGNGVSDQDKFCGSCGERVVIPVEQELTKTCGVCHTFVTDEAVYCPCCGHQTERVIVS